MGDGPAFTDTLQSDIQLLQSAGKNVMISVGGEVNNTNPAWTGWTSAKYKIFNENGTVAELVGIEGGVVSGVINLESSGVEASDWRPRHDEPYHEA